MTIQWKAVEQYFTGAVCFLFYPVGNFGLGIVRSEGVKGELEITSFYKEDYHDLSNG